VTKNKVTQGLQRAQEDRELSLFALLLCATAKLMKVDFAAWIEWHHQLQTLPLHAEDEVFRRLVLMVHNDVSVEPRGSRNFVLDFKSTDTSFRKYLSSVEPAYCIRAFVIAALRPDSLSAERWALLARCVPGVLVDDLQRFCCSQHVCT
jgi:hypothetical protein